jgi:hypothetical protein
MSKNRQFDNPSSIPDEEFDFLVDFCACTNAVQVLWWDIMNPHSWEGVEIEGGHITSIVLQNRNMAGTIPVSIGSLRHIVTLDLEGNSFTGPVPNELAQCAVLKGLYLSRNRFTALPPDVGSLNIKTLMCRDNHFSGELPPSFFKLRRAVKIDIECNRWEVGRTKQPYHRYCSAAAAALRHSATAP